MYEPECGECTATSECGDVTFVSSQGFPSTGTGEPGSVPVAAAIANALFEACDVRMRRLPLTMEAAAAAKEQPGT